MSHLRPCILCISYGQNLNKTDFLQPLGRWFSFWQHDNDGLFVHATCIVISVPL